MRNVPHIAADEEIVLYDALTQPADFQYVETPLEEVVRDLRQKYKIPIEIDVRAHRKIGISPDVPITRTVKDISLGAALRLMLRELEMTYILQDEVVLITTAEQAEGAVAVLRVYDVAHLVNDDADAEKLAESLQRIFDESPQDSFPVRIAAYRHLLLVNGGVQTHHNVATLLPLIRTGLQNQ